MQEQKTLDIETQAGDIETQAGDIETQPAGDIETQAAVNEKRAGDTDTRDGDEGAELVEELLIEEISIDGMCGVY